MLSRARSGGLVFAVCILSISTTATAEPPNRRSGGPTHKKRPVGEEASPQVFPEKVQWRDAKGGMYEEILEKEWVSPQQERAMDPNKVVAANQKEIARRVEAAGKALDRAEQHAAEWGHASIASAVLVKSIGEDGRSSPFSIRSGNDDSTYNYGYFEGRVRNSVQGAAARYAEKFLGARAEVQAGTDLNLQREGQIQEIQQQTRLLEALRLRKEAEAKLHPKPETKEDPDVKVLKDGSAAAEGEEATEEEEEEEEPDANAATDTLLPGLESATAGDDGTIQNLFTPSEFADYQALLTGKMKTASPAAQAAQANGQQAAERGEQPAAGAETPDLATLAVVADQLTLSEGDVMKSASSNLVMKKVLNYLTAPVDAGSNNVAWFMVTQVSVSPGSRTARDYVAETTLHPFYAELNGGKVEGEFDPNVLHPGIFAAFPLVEAQALDLRNSERFETRLSFALAAQLIAQGKKAEAKFFLERITKIQQDIATRTQLPLVVPSSNGREVTYRFDPALQGLMEPGNRKKGSGMVLNANSIPALIVIMTDRQSLDKYSHLYFELHTRWIPKKPSNIWATAWDGVVRNYNPRDPMNPSEVIGAAASLDEARAHLDWADRYKIDRLYGTTMATGLRAALDQARWRHSALASKIGSSNSNIALPLHFQIKPSQFKPVANEDQHILIERFSGKPQEIQLETIKRMSLGSVELDERQSYNSITDAQAKVIQNARSAQQALVASLEQELREGATLLEAVEQHILKKRTPKLSSKVRREGGFLGKGGTVGAWVEKVWGKKPPPEPQREVALTAAEDLALKNIRDIVPIYQNLADTLAESPEKYPDAVAKLRSLPDFNLIYGGLKDVLDLKEVELRYGGVGVEGLASISEALSQKLGNNTLLAPMRLVGGLKDYRFHQEAAAKAEGQIAGRGYYVRNEDGSFLVTLPADRSRNLPPGDLPIIGHFEDKMNSKKASFKFGNVNVEAPDIVQIAAVKGSELPPVVPQAGHNIAVVGSNLEQVRCAYWSASRGSLKILSKGKDSLYLTTKVIPRDEGFIILTDALEPPSKIESRILASFPVSYLKEEVTVATESVAAKASKPEATLQGYFPEKTQALIVTEGGKLPVDLVINAARNAGTIKLPLELFPDFPPSASKDLKIELKYEKSTAAVPLILKEDRISVGEVYPSTINADTVATDKEPDELTIAIKMDASLGDSARVFVGGMFLGSGKVKDGVLVVQGAEKLVPLRGKQTLALVCKNGEDFKWPDKILVTSSTEPAKQETPKKEE